MRNGRGGVCDSIKFRYYSEGFSKGVRVLGMSHIDWIQDWSVSL